MFISFVLGVVAQRHLIEKISHWYRHLYMQKGFGATFIQDNAFCFCWSNLAFRSTINRHLSGAKHWSSDCQVSFWGEIYANQSKREHGMSLFGVTLSSSVVALWSWIRVQIIAFLLIFEFFLFKGKKWSLSFLLSICSRY